MDDDERKRLLFPPWAANANGQRYDDLSADNQAVWRKTRGQHDDADQIDHWLDELRTGVWSRLVTEAEAEQAITRILGHDE